MGLLFLVSFHLINNKQSNEVLIDPQCVLDEKTQVTIISFNQVYGNANHRPTITFEIPQINVTSCRLVLTAYCDPDDVYLRAIRFHFDGIGGPIGCSAIAVSQVRGDTISPGQTVTYIYDMSHVQFANLTTWQGYYYQNFIPQDNESNIGVFSPGGHNVTMYVTSRDTYSGDTQDSWVSIVLYFNGETDPTDPGDVPPIEPVPEEDPLPEGQPGPDENPLGFQNLNSPILLGLLIGVLVTVVIVGAVLYSKLRENARSEDQVPRPYGSDTNTIRVQHVETIPVPTAQIETIYVPSTGEIGMSTHPQRAIRYKKRIKKKNKKNFPRDVIRCQSCGCFNGKDFLFCKRCGSELFENP
jgi:hypothetical protein